MEYTYSAQHRRQSGGASAGPVSSSHTAIRSQQIADYVTKQKTAKQNADLIRKERQRLAESKTIQNATVSRSTSASPYPNSSPYSSPALNGAPYSSNQNPPPNNSYQTPNYDPWAHAPPGAADRFDEINGADRRDREREREIDRTRDQDRTMSAHVRRSSSSVGVGVGGSGSGSGNASVGGGGGGADPSDQDKRIALLEEQVRLLKHQNRIFLSFMQNTEANLQKLMNGSHVSTHSNAQRNSAPSLNSSSSTSNTSSASSAASHNYDRSERVDRHSGSYEDDDEARRQERLRSAKRKEVERISKLKEKMKEKSAPSSGDDRRGYQPDAYGDHPPGSYPSASPHYTPSSHAAPQRASNSHNQESLQRHNSAQSAVRLSRQNSNEDMQYGSQPHSHNMYGGGGSSSSGGGSSNFVPAGIPAEALEPVETFPCPDCGRKFNEQALEKHIAKAICRKGPRKVFDMQKVRLEELVAEGAVSLKKVKNPPSTNRSTGGDDSRALKKAPKWKQDHEKFMAAIKAGKQISAAVKQGIPLSQIPNMPTQEEHDDRTPCPHCGRKFSANVAERHIPHCKNTINRPKPVGSAVGPRRR